MKKLFLIVALIGALMFGGCTTTVTADQSNDAGVANDSPLVLEPSWKFSKGEYGSAQVTGYVKNNTDKAYTGYIQITFDLLDADGSNIGQCMDNTNTLDANGRWKFKAVCFDADGAKKARFKEITGF